MSSMGLRKELRAVGAGSREAEQLADVAQLLGSIKTRGMSAETKKRLAPAPEAAKKPRTWIAWSAGGAFATACLLLIVAQSALPGSWLYPVKRTTEEARAAVQSDYKDNLVEKREDEVERLKLKKADPAVLEEAEKSYKNSVEQSLERYRRRTGSDQGFQQNFKPRYDWSQRWYQGQGYTQGWRSN